MAGFFTTGMPSMDTAPTTAVLVPADTYTEEGAPPQSVGLGLAQTASGVIDVQIPLTGFTITVDDGVSSLILNPAGTLATGTITLPANPYEGQYLELVSTQTQTALTVTANTGQTIVGAAVTALVAVTAVKYYYLATKWYRVR